MDKLSAEQQADVKELSTEALKAKLVKVGYAKEEIAAMERPKMLELWAQSIVEKKGKLDAAEAVEKKSEETSTTSLTLQLEI